MTTNILERILIVDDNEENRKAARVAFPNAEIANNAREAQEMIRTNENENRPLARYNHLNSGKRDKSLNDRQNQKGSKYLAGIEIAEVFTYIADAFLFFLR